MGPSFECPICGYIGAFASVKTKSGSRKFAVCLNCNAMERHRLQKLAFDKVTGELDLNNLDFLHISPEPCHREMLHGIGNYVTADLQMPDVDYHFDLQERAPFPDGLFDIVFASHVLEHILDDNHAIAEIRRIIKPGGFAILPVPIVSEATIDYGESNAFETGHVRAPGYDYFDRYRKHFDRVNEITSESFPEKYQLYLYEDRSIYPTSESPLRKPMPGVKHKDIVPICYV
ncbi:MAG: SAM-dependent methyltransferase, partial [Tenericutes bacterium]